MCVCVCMCAFACACVTSSKANGNNGGRVPAGRWPNFSARWDDDKSARGGGGVDVATILFDIWTLLRRQSGGDYWYPADLRRSCQGFVWGGKWRMKWCRFLKRSLVETHDWWTRRNWSRVSVEFLWFVRGNFFFIIDHWFRSVVSSLPYLIMRFIIYAIYAKRNSRSRILGHRISRIWLKGKQAMMATCDWILKEMKMKKKNYFCGKIFYARWIERDRELSKYVC